MMYPVLAILSPAEIVIVVIVLLLIFGAKKLPELAKGMGKSIGEFKKARDESDQETPKKKDDES